MESNNWYSIDFSFKFQLLYLLFWKNVMYLSAFFQYNSLCRKQSKQMFTLQTHSLGQTDINIHAHYELHPYKANKKTYILVHWR